MKFAIDLGKPPRGPSQRRDERPFKVLVVGDFGGTSFALNRVDIDTFEAVMTAAKPKIELQLAALGESRLDLEFRTLDDFHPDAIVRNCGVFAALREERARPAPPAKAEGEMFERLLGSSGREAPAPPVTQSSVVQRLISSVVAPHVVPDRSQEQDRHVAFIDAATATLMRDILHAPAFQKLEAAWRGARTLLDETEGGEEVQVWLLDASTSALRDDIVRSADDPTRSKIFDILVGRAERAPDADPWSIVIGDHLFGPADDDLYLLATLGALCRRAGALFVGGASPQLTGGAVSDAWDALRSQSFASSVALAAPRTLVRLPYGKAFDAIDSFAFEELDGATHESFLWGNSAVTLGRLLIRGFVARGWDMEPGDELDLADLPMVVRGEGDDRAMQACAENYLGERGGEQLLNRGLVPVLSYEGRAAVRLMRVQSISQPPTALTL
jgi:predicted component of type VI protein secretion system